MPRTPPETGHDKPEIETVAKTKQALVTAARKKDVYTAELFIVTQGSRALKIAKQSSLSKKDKKFLNEQVMPEVLKTFFAMLRDGDRLNEYQYKLCYQKKRFLLNILLSEENEYKNDLDLLNNAVDPEHSLGKFFGHHKHQRKQGQDDTNSVTRIKARIAELKQEQVERLDVGSSPGSVPVDPRLLPMGSSFATDPENASDVDSDDKGFFVEYSDNESEADEASRDRVDLNPIARAQQLYNDAFDLDPEAKLEVAEWEAKRNGVNYRRFDTVGCSARMFSGSGSSDDSHEDAAPPSQRAGNQAADSDPGSSPPRLDRN